MRPKGLIGRKTSSPALPRWEATYHLVTRFLALHHCRKVRGIFVLSNRERATAGSLCLWDMIFSSSLSYGPLNRPSAVSQSIHPFLLPPVLRVRGPVWRICVVVSHNRSGCLTLGIMSVDHRKRGCRNAAARPSRWTFRLSTRTRWRSDGWSRERVLDGGGTLTSIWSRGPR